MKSRGMARSLAMAPTATTTRPAPGGRSKAHRAPLRPPADPMERRAILAVEAIWQVAGHGPTWSQLGRLVGWTRPEQSLHIRRLAWEGWLYYGREPGSLTLRPRAREALRRQGEGARRGSRP